MDFQVKSKEARKSYCCVNPDYKLHAKPLNQKKIKKEIKKEVHSKEINKDYSKTSKFISSFSDNNKRIKQRFKIKAF